MAFRARQLDPERAKWMVCQTKGKYFAYKSDFSESYDPEKINEDNPVVCFLEGRFDEQKVKDLVTRLNRKSPLTLVIIKEGKLVVKGRAHRKKITLVQRTSSGDQK
jgi:hypothetical protein